MPEAMEKEPAPPTDVDADLRARKQAMRATAQRARAAIPGPELATRAAEIERRLMALPEMDGARIVLAFHAFGSEVPTAGLVARLQREGRRVLLPQVRGERMEAVGYRPGAAMTRARYGAMEPAGETAADPRSVDLVVAPGLSFDRAGRRLGYGGGFFDGYLRRVRPECAVVGIAFHEQLVDEVPAGPADVPVGIVVTDREVIRAPDAPRSGPGSAAPHL
jgi:5-formyltetrahydrofolate cyclo-ligase